MKTKTNNQINKILFFDSNAKKAGTIELDKTAFDGKPNKTLLYQSLVMYRANQRRGTASTKVRSKVSGSGKKPWKQKGTGRARVGSIRNPVWRGGGIIFGPHPRDYRYSMPKKMKRGAFIASINAKLKSGKVSGIEDITLSEPKTKKFCKLLKGLNITESALFLVDKIDKNLALATRNIEKLTLKKINVATSLDVLSSDHLVLTKAAIDALNKKGSE